MLGAKKLIVGILNCSFYVSPEYLDGYIFCGSTGRVYVSDKAPTREQGAWDLGGVKFDIVGKVRYVSLTEKEVMESLQPLRGCIIAVTCSV